MVIWSKLILKKGRPENKVNSNNLYMQNNPAHSSPCPICKGNEFTWGDLRAQGIKFVPGDGSVLDKLGLTWGTKIQARQCNACHNVQMFNA